METGKMFIGGEWVASSSGETREVINPYDASVICHVAEGTVEDAEHAIAAAKKAFYEDGWGDTPAYERAALLRMRWRQMWKSWQRRRRSTPARR